ncbi:TrmH family RNA methyltransferase [Auritidibacter ignavus]|uniref:TrmH family RNA methyltransferase n=1 Tax=Auritidibacter TaxID=1160973 RepID=UPI000D73FE6D|nr:MULTISPECIES: TrmH family RNA methyltransferase [Auritidibacter]AXR74841.1 RNA methyltransferase [Auritidibacter sp. NML130574]WGH81385.1 TrmH family RNA methyltransferase [Auritidibacter ignavus]WGH90599.1 TrmH family RNA methyltransferase [Auritidibacter ignavus]WHS35577.1 TrmH family RNA methyltransferase [Auritidibacter ignavus]
MHKTTPLHHNIDRPGEDHTIIDDSHHPVARRISDVLRNRSSKPKIILIDDLENIEQAVRNNVRLDSLYMTEGSQPASINDTIFEYGEFPTHTLSRDVADGLFGGEKQSRIFALAKAPRPAKLSDLSETESDIVVLDGVRLVGNIGAITRTSVGFGTAGLILLDSGLQNVFDRRLIRASRGLVFALPIVLTTVDEFARYIHRERISVGTLTAHATDSLESAWDIAERMAIVLGSERHGVSEKLNTIADYKYAIPMSPEVESLNVSVSAGIALYERSRSHPTST